MDVVVDDLSSMQLRQRGDELQRQREEGLEVELTCGEQRLQRRPTPILEHQAAAVVVAQQPMDSDLRLITEAMKINADLERIGDQAVNIAEQAVRILGHPPLKPQIDLPRMAEIAERMTRESLDAFVRKDADLARAILARDDEVDQLKDHVFRVLLTYMMADPGTIERALSLILVSRHLERIADHATNIAEDVIFVVEAKDVRHHHEERKA